MVNGFAHVHTGFLHPLPEHLEEPSFKDRGGACLFGFFFRCVPHVFLTGHGATSGGEDQFEGSFGACSADHLAGVLERKDAVGARVDAVGLAGAAAHGLPRVPQDLPDVCRFSQFRQVPGSAGHLVVQQQSGSHTAFGLRCFCAQNPNVGGFAAQSLCQTQADGCFEAGHCVGVAHQQCRRQSQQRTLGVEGVGQHERAIAFCQSFAVRTPRPVVGGPVFVGHAVQLAAAFADGEAHTFDLFTAGHQRSSAGAYTEVDCPNGNRAEVGRTEVVAVGVPHALCCGLVDVCQRADFKGALPAVIITVRNARFVAVDHRQDLAQGERRNALARIGNALAGAARAFAHCHIRGA